MKTTRKEVNKPYTKVCWHYYNENGEHVGAIWQSDLSDQWSAFCTASLETYGNCGDFQTEGHAEKALKDRLTATVDNAD